jgi:putative addiction module component (TIGR02574 family)
MESTYNAIFEAALQLPESDRLTLVSRLLETMPTEDSSLSLDDPSLAEELDRRFADHAGSVPWSGLRDEGFGS